MCVTITGSCEIDTQKELTGRTVGDVKSRYLEENRVVCGPLLLDRCHRVVSRDVLHLKDGKKPAFVDNLDTFLESN